MKVRKGEPEKVWFRADRCFSVGNEWYVATREGKDMGPFKTRKEALNSVPRYIINKKVGKKSVGMVDPIEPKKTKDIWATNNYI